MTKRRSAHEGSIFKRKDGRWVSAVTLPSGKRWRKYSRSQADARAKLRDMLRQSQEGFSLSGSRATMADFLRHWLTIGKPNLRPKTHAQYTQITERYIIPGIGAYRVSVLRPDHIQKLYATLLERGIGARTVRLTHAVLHRALNQALKWTLVPRNPAAAVDKPKAQRAEMRVWTVEQAQAFLAAIRDHRLYALYHLAITTGLRRGELLGLKWSDLDGDRLSVQRQLQRVPGAGLTLSEPKTARGRRSVTLARVDLAALRERRETQQRERLFAGDAWQDSGLIFTTPKGTPCDPDNAGHTFRTLTLAVGLPPLRFHDLRHTAATIMLTRGVHPKVVQERLGHASIELTMDTYSHVVANMQAHAAAQIDALFEQ